MSREPEGQGDDGQRRIGETAGGKNRAAGDEEIRHVMHSAIGIDHAVSGIVVHPRGAQEVMRAVESPVLGAASFLHRDESADTGGSQFLAKNLLCLADAAQIPLVPAPEHLDFSLAVAVASLMQHYAVRAVRRLLDEGADSKFPEAMFRSTESRPAALTLRIILFEHLQLRCNKQQLDMTKTELQVALATATETNKRTAGVFLDTLSNLAYKAVKKNGEFGCPDLASS